jgi:UDP-glucose 4-epimerase
MTIEPVILITGAAGMVGQALLAELSERSNIGRIIATDIAKPEFLPSGAEFRKLDVTSDDVERVISETRPDVIVHLASIVTPPKGMDPGLAYQVDVEGSRKILRAAIDHKIKRLVVTSSGAAYGYHESNPVPLTEKDALRGNPEFAYSHHKRLVEEMLADARQAAPELDQVILRVGTILGAGTENQITALFRRKKILAIKGSESPFVFIWTKDLAKILVRAATDGPLGIFNVAGDGAMGVSELAMVLGKPVLRLPAWVLKLVLAIAKPLKLTRYGPEQVRFLQFRPVLDNHRLKVEFGYSPELNSREVFDLWRRDAGI